MVVCIFDLHFTLEWHFLRRNDQVYIIVPRCTTFTKPTPHVHLYMILQIGRQAHSHYKFMCGSRGGGGGPDTPPTPRFVRGGVLCWCLLGKRGGPKVIFILFLLFFFACLFLRLAPLVLTKVLGSAPENNNHRSPLRTIFFSSLYQRPSIDRKSDDSRVTFLGQATIGRWSGDLSPMENHECIYYVNMQAYYKCILNRLSYATL